MIYKIRQTYTNYVTGETWTRIVKKTWKTRRGAEKAAQTVYSWVTMPDGKNPTSDSSAEVIGGAA